ncbi:MAG: ankyrin repeat domain-containing protein, partial [Pseudomonadota bacterium]|nr:ankyrin repeat domain-containing protein [Pseudomonadota bacterium]
MLQRFAYRYPYSTSIVMVLMAFFIVKALVYQAPERDNRGRTALYLAAEHGDIVEVAALLDSVDTPDQRDDCLWTPLMRASQNGHRAVAHLLLEAGADVNAVDKGGYSVLMVTAGEGSPELVRLLLEYQPDLDAQEPTLGWT